MNCRWKLTCNTAKFLRPSTGYNIKQSTEVGLGVQDSTFKGSEVPAHRLLVAGCSL